MKNNISKLKIKGGNPTFGNVEINGDSINALALIVRGLMQFTSFEVSNVPRSSVVFDFIKTLEVLGIKIDWGSVDTLKIFFDKSYPFDISYLDDEKSLNFVRLLVPLILKKRGVCKISSLVKEELAFYKRRGFDVKTTKKYATITFEKELVNFKSVINLTQLTSQYEISARFLILNLVGFSEDELNYVLNTTGILDTWYANLLIEDGSNSNKLRVRSSRLEFSLISAISVLTHGEIEISNYELSEVLPFLLLLGKFGGKYLVSNNKLKIWCEDIDLDTYYDFTYLDNDYMGFVLILGVLSTRRLNKLIQVTIRKTDEVIKFIRTLNILGFDLITKEFQHTIIVLIKPMKLPVKIKLSVPALLYIGPLLSLAISLEGNHSLTEIDDFPNYSPNVIDILKSLDINLIAK